VDRGGPMSALKRRIPGPIAVLLLSGIISVVAGVASVGDSVGQEVTDRHRSTAGVAIYSNDDGLQIISPHSTVRQPVARGWAIDGGFKADLITAASVDVITAATPAISEKRYEGRLGVQGELGRLRTSAGYTTSIEQDTHTHMIDVAGEVDLLQRNLTLKLGLAAGMDSLGLRDLSTDFWRDRTTMRLDAVATQILGRSTVASFAYTGQYMQGLLASLYRRVPLFPRDEELRVLGNLQWTAERHPEQRTRHGFTVTGKHALTSWLFTGLRWRGYLDTWAMRSHEGEVSVGVDLGRGFTVELAERLYWQSRVSFYRAIYTVNRDYITRDRRLGGMLSNIAKLDVRWVGQRFEVLARGALHWTRYDDFRVPVAGRFEPMADTMAMVIQLALAMTL